MMHFTRTNLFLYIQDEGQEEMMNKLRVQYESEYETYYY